MTSSPSLPFNIRDQMVYIKQANVSIGQHCVTTKKQKGHGNGIELFVKLLRSIKVKQVEKTN